MTSADFRRYREKHGMVLSADEETAQFVEFRGAYYTDDWLRGAPDGAPQAEQVDIVQIGEQEYTEIAEQLDSGDIPVDDSLDEEIPSEGGEDEEPETVQRTAAQILEEQIRMASIFAEV